MAERHVFHITESRIWFTRFEYDKGPATSKVQNTKEHSRNTKFSYPDEYILARSRIFSVSWPESELSLIGHNVRSILEWFYESM